MKDINDIMSQFDDLQALPVSEEMLGAYIEGTLGPLEELDVQQACATSRLAGAVVSSSRQDGTGVLSDFLNDVELSVLEELDIKLPELPAADAEGHDDHDFPADGPDAAFEGPFPAYPGEGPIEALPLQDYADAGSNDLDNPFSDDFLQSE